MDFLIFFFIQGIVFHRKKVKNVRNFKEYRFTKSGMDRVSGTVQDTIRKA